MKQTLAFWRKNAAFAAGCVLLAAGLNAIAQPFASPVGEWDIVESGSRQGVARMIFNADHTITLSEIIVPKELVSNTDPRTSTTSRGTGGDDSRGGTLTNSTPTTPHTNIFGFIGFPFGPEINETNSDGNAIWLHNGISAGAWNFDGTGKIVGFFTEVSGPMAIVTNLIPIGNPTNCQDVTIVTNGQAVILTVCETNQYLTNVEYLRITNSVSFSGKVTLNFSDFTKSRLTLLTVSASGRATFSGMIPIELPDASGLWFGIMKKRGLTYNEFFTLSPLDFNYYSVDGIDTGLGGAGYQFGGSILIVRQKKFGLDIDVQPTPYPMVEHVLHIRAVVGSVDLKHGRISSQQAVQDSGSSLDTSGATVDRISYKAQLLPPASE